jgi:CubicO group peptidase (beta-lactamase class C family)
MKRAVSTASLALFVTGAAFAAPMAPTVSGALGAKLDRYLTDSGYVGVALVAKDGQIALMKGYGLADRDKNVPYAADTLVSVGSITKQFTAAAILKLEQEGKLSVEDSVGKYFKDAPEDKRAITLHQLLTHTSGLESDFAGDYEPVGRDEYVGRILGSKLRAKPGAEHAYANSNYSLLAAIVEIASGQPYERYLQDHLFAPAHMSETGYRIPKWESRRVPVGYKDGKRWGTMLEKPWAADGPYWALRGNGGIESTLSDLWTWSRALDTDAVLSAAERKKLFTPYVKEGPNGGSQYAYGWSISTTPWNTKLIAHDGGNGVFSADFRRYVDDRIVVITGTGDSTVKAWKFSGPLGRIAHGEEVAPQPPQAMSPGSLKPLADGPRATVIRAFVEAFNAKDIEKMHAFRAAHMPSRPGGPTEEQRDEVTRRMRDELGALTIDGVLKEDDQAVTVRMKPAAAPPVTIEFMFNPENKISGMKIEAGD